MKRLFLLPTKILAIILGGPAKMTDQKSRLRLWIVRFYSLIIIRYNDIMIFVFNQSFWIYDLNQNTDSEFDFKQKNLLHDCFGPKTLDRAEIFYHRQGLIEKFNCLDKATF